MVSLGTFPARALSIAVRRRGLPAGSPPDLAATVISLSNLVQPLDFLASVAALVCLILDQRLCPDIPDSLPTGIPNTQVVATQGQVTYPRRRATPPPAPRPVRRLVHPAGARAAAAALGAPRGRAPRGEPRAH